MGKKEQEGGPGTPLGTGRGFQRAWWALRLFHSLQEGTACSRQQPRAPGLFQLFLLLLQLCAQGHLGEAQGGEESWGRQIALWRFLFPVGHSAF